MGRKGAPDNMASTGYVPPLSSYTQRYMRNFDETKTYSYNVDSQREVPFFVRLSRPPVSSRLHNVDPPSRQEDLRTWVPHTFVRNTIMPNAWPPIAYNAPKGTQSRRQPQHKSDRFQPLLRMMQDLDSNTREARDLFGRKDYQMESGVVDKARLAILASKIGFEAAERAGMPTDDLSSKIDRILQRSLGGFGVREEHGPQTWGRPPSATRLGKSPVWASRAAVAPRRCKATHSPSSLLLSGSHGNETNKFFDKPLSMPMSSRGPRLPVKTMVSGSKPSTTEATTTRKEDERPPMDFFRPLTDREALWAADLKETGGYAALHSKRVNGCSSLVRGISNPVAVGLAQMSDRPEPASPPDTDSRKRPQTVPDCSDIKVEGGSLLSTG